MNNHYINKNKTADIYITAVFILAEAILYMIFMWIDWTSEIDTTYYKFISICLCLSFAIYSAFSLQAEGIFTLIALAFTVASDLFMLVLDKHYTLAVCLFIPVQLLYWLRIRISTKKPCYMSIIARFCMILAILIALYAMDGLELLTAMTAIYFSMLLCNAIESCFYAKSLDKLLFCIGLWLFVLCDVCVGLFNIGDVLGVSLSPEFFYTVSVLMWGFYLPSQVLIVTSLKGKNKE